MKPDTPFEWPKSVLLICGHPCCLKSSVARILSFRYETFALFTHQLGRIRAMWGEHFIEQRARRYQNTLAILPSVLKCDLPVIVEGTFALRDERMSIAELCRKHAYPLLVVYSSASVTAMIENRFEHRSLQRTGPDHHANDTSIYFDSLRTFERITDQERQVYTSFVEVDSTRKEIVRRVSSQTAYDCILDVVETVYREIPW